MFLELRFGADNGGGVKGRRGVCGFKNFRLLEQVRRDSRGQSVRERAVSESSACTSAAFRCFEKKSDFPLVGSLSRRYYWENAHQPVRGGSTTVQLLRCSWNCGSARIAAASQGATQSLRVQKTPACWNMRAGIAVGSLYGNGQFPKVPHLLLRRFDVLGKSDFPLVGSLSCLYYWEKPHQSARKEYAASPARVKFPDGNAQQRMRATCRVCRSGTQLFSAAHACDFKVANGLVVLYKYVPRRQRV